MLFITQAKPVHDLPSAHLAFHHQKQVDDFGGSIFSRQGDGRREIVTQLLKEGKCAGGLMRQVFADNMHP